METLTKIKPKLERWKNGNLKNGKTWNNLEKWKIVKNELSKTRTIGTSESGPSVLADDAAVSAGQQSRLH